VSPHDDAVTIYTGNHHHGRAGINKFPVGHYIDPLIFNLCNACGSQQHTKSWGHRLNGDLIRFSYRDMPAPKALLSNIGQIEKKYFATQIPQPGYVIR
jgi:hypothetical protein